MSFPAAYKDQGKNSNELLNKGFPSTDKFNWKFEIDTTSENGVQFLPSITNTPGRGVDAELKSKFKVKEANLTLTGNQKEELSVEIAAAKKLQDLWKPSITVSTTTRFLQEKLKFKPSVEFRKEWVTATVALEMPVKQPEEGSDDPKDTDHKKATFSTVFGHKSCGFSAGFDLEYQIDSSKLKHFNSVVSYGTADLEVSAFSKTKCDGSPTTIGANYYQKLANKWKEGAVAAEVTYPLHSLNQPPSFSVGGSFQPDASSTLKSRVNNKGLAGFAYTQKWGGPFTVTFSSEFNLLNPLAQDSAQYGVKIAVK